MLLLLLASQAQTGYSRPSLDGEGAQALSRRHMMADNELVHPLSMQPGTDDWEKHAQADFLLDLPSWEDEQGEVHPLDSPELRGPFEYSETEERELAKNLAVDDSEWNASSGGIGGRPRPRYCVLDKAWRASKHPRMDFSSSGFRKMLRAALKEKRLHDLLVNDRYQEARGHDVLTGELLTMDILSSYSCPVLRTYAEAGVSPLPCLCPCSLFEVGGMCARCQLSVALMPVGFSVLSRLELRDENARAPTKRPTKV